MGEIERRAGLVALALLAMLAWQAGPTIPVKSVTFDEPAHIGAGLSYLSAGSFA
jgi:hypothetical protein